MTGQRKATLFIFLIFLNLFCINGNSKGAEKFSARPITEEELAIEKFLTNLETTLANKFFDHRQRPVVGIAVFDFTDGAGNIPKWGREITDKIVRRLYFSKQFAVASRQKIDKYLKWNGVTALGKVNAEVLYRWQRRIKTLDPDHGLHVLVTGEVQKGVGRSVRLSANIINFMAKIGPLELEKNILDIISINAEIPLPTEQALKEALEIIQRGEFQGIEEGRLLILANNRGQNLIETEFIKRFSKDQPFPWAQVPLLFFPGVEEGLRPENVQIGLNRLLLSPVTLGTQQQKQLEYSFLHGKCATNIVYFDENVPAQNYRLVATLMDAKNYETNARAEEIKVFPRTTTLVVLSFYVPSEKERLRSKQVAQINIFQIWGKGMEIFPETW